MRLLLDTHTLLWWLSDNPSLPAEFAAQIDDPRNAILVSAATAWEICTKVRIGKLPGWQSLSEDFSGCLNRFNLEPLAVSVEHGRLAGRLAGAHRDPFDRMLAAQSIIEHVAMVTNDPAMVMLGAQVHWTT